MTDKQKAINENAPPIGPQPVSSVAAQAQPSEKESIPYPFLPDGLIVAARHDKLSGTVYRAEHRDEENRLVIGGGWQPTRQAATAEAWAIKCEIMTAQQPVSGADGDNATIKESLSVDERASFEWWASDEGESPKAVERAGHGYSLAQIQGYWVAWQARAALAQQDGDKVAAEIPAWAYAGVTVWVGDKKVTKVAIQMDVDACRDDKLLRLFEGARFAINEANKELGQ